MKQTIKSKYILELNQQEVVYGYDGYADGCPVYDVAHCPVCNHEFENEVEPWG